MTMSRPEDVAYEPFLESHLEGAVALCRELSWPSYSDPTTALGAFSASGAVTWIARRGADVVGLAHLLTDGYIHSHLSLVGVLPAHRRQGIARVLVREAFRAGGGKWLDLVSEPGSEPFYRSFVNQERIGFRVYPDVPAAQRADDVGVE
jgi:ribosomal protein S18 acetylase RimI-like enzyme